MQLTSTFKLRLLSLACVSTALALSGTASGQGIEGGRTGTSTADNPFLRQHDEPGKTQKKIVKISDKDVTFIQRAATGDEQEIENGKMAIKKAQSAAVKKVASRMVQDHTRMNNELLALAKKKGVGVTTGTIKAQNIGTAGFDKAYIDMIERDHKAEVAQFEKEAKSGGDADIKAWAAKTLPTERTHLAMIKETSNQVK